MEDVRSPKLQQSPVLTMGTLRRRYKADLISGRMSASHRGQCPRYSEYLFGEFELAYAVKHIPSDRT